MRVVGGLNFFKWTFSDRILGILGSRKYLKKRFQDESDHRFIGLMKNYSKIIAAAAVSKIFFLTINLFSAVRLQTTRSRTWISWMDAWTIETENEINFYHL